MYDLPNLHLVLLFGTGSGLITDVQVCGKVFRLPLCQLVTKVIKLGNLALETATGSPEADLWY